MADEKMTLVERLNNPAREQDGSLSETVTHDMREAAQLIEAYQRNDQAKR